MKKLNAVHVFNNDITKSYSTSVSAETTIKSASDYFIGQLGHGICFVDENKGTYEFAGVVNYRNLKKFDLVDTYYLVSGKQPFIVTFVGREKGAIGIACSQSIVVLAENEEEARTRIYDTHEHCSKVKIELIKG